MDSEIVKIKDAQGFHYQVTFEYKPHFGFTTAGYNGQILGQCELGRIRQPMSDDDREWARYEERFSEWRDEIKGNLIPICEKHFNNEIKRR